MFKRKNNNFKLNHEKPDLQAYRMVDKWLSITVWQRIIMLLLTIMLLVAYGIILKLKEPIIIEKRLFGNMEEDSVVLMRPAAEGNLQAEKLNIFISKIIELVQLDHKESFNHDSYRLLNSCERIALEEVKKQIEKGVPIHSYFGSGIEIIGDNKILNQNKDLIHGKVMYRKYYYFSANLEKKDFEFEYIVRQLSSGEEKYFFQAIQNGRKTGEKIIVPLGTMFGYKLANFQIKEI